MSEPPGAVHASVAFASMERRLRAYLTALYDIRPVLRAVAGDDEGSSRRASYDGGFISLPEAFTGVPDGVARRLFTATVAHAGAHLLFSEPFDRKGLRPIQIALVSLVEDARIEHLALSQFPGLARLWAPFHVAEAGGPRIATSMMASLARALFDEAYEDSDPWVRKGRDAFYAARSDWADQMISRRIGSLLGNDLGQMRVQFNAKTYVVEPAYRDDNLGLWLHDDDPDTQAAAEDVFEHIRIEREERENDGRSEPAEGEASGTAQVKAAEDDAGIPVARHPEWDYFIGASRNDWTTVLEYEPRPASTRGLDRIYHEHADVLARIDRLVRSAKVSRPLRLRRQAAGERLDLDAAIGAMIERRSGLSPDPRVYETSVFRGRDLSILVLLDISESTRDFVERTTTTVLSMERAATALLAEAMEGSGDPFAILAFCSNGRSDVRSYRVKAFGEAFGAAQKARLAGLRSGYSTRMGAAIRHAATHLRHQPTHRRLLLVVTDGEPSDIDVPDGKYLVEDARRAVQQLAGEGIDTFCVGLDRGGDVYLGRIFGRRNVVQIDKLSALPERLPMLYFRLTR